MKTKTNLAILTIILCIFFILLSNEFRMYKIEKDIKEIMGYLEPALPEFATLENH